MGLFVLNCFFITQESNGVFAIVESDSSEAQKKKRKKKKKT
jgi:hypothetical protein